MIASRFPTCRSAVGCNGWEASDKNVRPPVECEYDNDRYSNLYLSLIPVFARLRGFSHKGHPGAASERPNPALLEGEVDLPLRDLLENRGYSKAIHGPWWDRHHLGAESNACLEGKGSSWSMDGHRGG